MALQFPQDIPGARLRPEAHTRQARPIPIPEVLKSLEESLGILDSNLTEATAARFNEELAWITIVEKSAESRATREIKDPDSKKKASALFPNLKKDLSALAKFKGKDPDKFKDSVQKAREKVQSLKDLPP